MLRFAFRSSRATSILSSTSRTSSFALVAPAKLTPPFSYASTRNMSEIKKVFTANACPPAGPYSQAIIAGPQIFVSGQIPANNKGELIDGSIADKTKQCCENIKGILGEINVGMDRVVKVNVFLDDMAHFAEMNGVFEQYFAHKPARSCVAVKTLPKNVPVEIECIAYNGGLNAKL